MDASRFFFGCVSEMVFGGVSSWDFSFYSRTDGSALWIAGTQAENLPAV